MKKFAFILLVALMGLGGCGEVQKAQKNTPKTPAELEVACNNSDMESCANLILPSFYARDFSKVNILSQKACDSGSGKGCAFLGILYEDGLGSKEQDNVKAQKLWDKAIPLLEKECDNNQALSCEILGDAYIEAHFGMQEDFAKGKKFAEKACDLDKAHCNGLAYIYAEGKGVEQDYSKAIALLKQSCEAGTEHACFALGIHYENGEGVEQDIHKAKELYKKACDMRYQTACEIYQNLQDKQDN